MTATFVGMPTFPVAARAALADTQLRRNLAHATGTIRAKRAAVVAEVAEWEALLGLPCLLVRNPDPSRGQGSSLRLGLDALPARSGASVVLLADMPRVTAALLAALVEGYRRSGAPLVLADYGGTLAPPVLYERALFAELTDPSDAPGKQVVARHRDRAHRVPFPPEALLDLDLPADLARHLQPEGGPP